MSKLKPFNDNILLDEPELIDWSVAVKTIILNDNVIDMHHKKLNWVDVIRYQTLSENIIEKYINLYNFDDMIRYQKVSVEFLNKHIDKISVYTMKLVFIYQKLPHMWLINRINDVKDHTKLFKELFEILVKHQKIDEDTLAAYVVAMTNDEKKNPVTGGTNHANLMNVKEILVEAETKRVKDEFDQKMKNDLNSIQQNPIKVPEKWAKIDKPPIDMMLITTVFSSGEEEIKKLIKRYVEFEFDTSENPNNLITDPDVHTTISGWIDERKIWDNLTDYNMSEDFIAKYHKKLNLSVIFRSNIYDESLWYKLEKAGCKLTPLEAYAFMKGVGETSYEFGSMHLKYAKWWDYYTELPDLTDFDYEGFVKNTKWYLLVEKNILPEWFMSYFADVLDWWRVPRYQRNLTMEFIQKHIDKIDLEQTCIYQKLSIEFLRQYKDFLPWDALSLWQPFTPEMLEEFADLITDNIKRNKHFKREEPKLTTTEDEKGELMKLLFEDCDSDIKIDNPDDMIEDFLAEERKKLVDHQNNIDLL